MINSHLLLSDPRHYKCLTIGGCLVNNSAATIAAAISLWLWNESSLQRKILWKILLKRRQRRVRVPFVSRSIQRLIGATGETITLCFWRFTQPTLIFLSLQHRGMSLKKYCIPLETTVFTPPLCLHMQRFHTSSIYSIGKAACSAGEGSIIPFFFWFAVSRVHVPTCTFHTRTHFFISLLNGFQQRQKMNSIWLSSAHSLLD